MMRRAILRLFLLLIAFFVLVACTNPEEMLNQAMEEIEDHITGIVDQDFSLPELSDKFKDVVVSWKSSNTDIIANDGKFTQPILDTEVKITVTLEYKDKKLEKEFTVTAVGKTEAERAKLAKDELTLPVDPVTNDLILPTKNDKYGATITWESSDESVISTNGKITRSQTEDVTVILTATIKVGSATETKAFEITVKRLSVTDVFFTAPTKTEYIYGEELDLTGGKLTIKYEDDSEKEVPLTSEMVAGFNNESLGEQMVTVTYDDKTFTFKVTVKDKLDELELIKPTRLEYVYGEDLDLTGGKIIATYRSGKVIEMDLTLSMVTGYHAELLGEQELTVTYEGYKLTFKVTVVDAIDRYEFVAPTKIRYFLGESLDLTGGCIKEIYKSGAVIEIELEASMVSGFDDEKLGEQELTVTYQGETFTFKVYVIQEDYELVIPDKLEYLYGDDLDLTGGKIIITNNLGETEDVPLTLDMISGYDPNQLGEQALTVTYRGVTFTFSITVKDAVATVEFKAPHKRSYLYGEDLDVAGGVFILKYRSGYEEEIGLTVDDVTGFDANSPGKQTLSVMYGDHVFTYDVTVAKEDAVKLPTPFGIVQDGRGIRWGRNGEMDLAEGFYIHITGLDEPVWIPLVYELPFLQLGLEPGDYEIRLQAVGDGVDYLNSDLAAPIKITVPYFNGNLSRKGKASASSGNANEAIDGNMTSRWESAHGIDDVYFMIDFGSRQTFSIVRIYWESAYAKRYILQISDDGETWTDVYTENESDGGLDEIIFEVPIEARYVRIHCLERATRYGYSIWEFEIYLKQTPNLAKEEGTSASASSGNAQAAIDGNYNSRWESAFEDDQQFVLDLGQIRTFDTIVIFWESAYGKEYFIEVSADGETWETIYIEEESDGAVDNLLFEAVEARYIRWNGMKRATSWGYSFYEFEVYYIGHEA